MKKILSLVLIMTVVLTLGACSALEGLDLPPLPDVESIKEEARQTPQPIPADPAPTPAFELDEHVIVNITPHEELFMDPQNGTETILEFSYETPVVYVEGRDEATRIINEHIAHLNETYQTGNDYGFGTADGVNLLLEMATDNYSYIVNSGEEGLSMLYASSRTVKTSRMDENVLSLVFNTYTYTGGAHGTLVDRAYVFDTLTGEHVKLDMLSEDSEAFTAFLTDYMVKLYEADEDAYYSQRVVEDSFEGAEPAEVFASLIRDGSWYLGNDGLVIFSDVYELGPYAAGMTEFVIPYEELEPYVDEKWLPLPRQGEGSFTLLQQAELTDGSAQVIDRVTVDEGGRQLAVQVEGVVYDVKLSNVAYSDVFYETASLWSCSYMKDCVLQLDVLIPEGMPDLMLSYTDADFVEHRLLLTQSGEDGSLILSDDDIQAVG